MYNIAYAGAYRRRSLLTGLHQMIMTREKVDAMFHPYEQKLRDSPMIILFETVTNEDDGIEALIMDGTTDRHSYRVVYRDTDADETIGVVFCDTYLDAKRYADDFTRKT